MNDKRMVWSDINFPSLLGLLFIGLKLGGAIDWSWWWVLSPFWLPFVLLPGVVAVLFFFAWILGRL